MSSMSGNPNQPARATIRDLKREMADASNSKILSIVAALDSVADRGSADDLISPIRARLAKLQPPRRLRFSRLLFHPLTPLIVPASRWRPASGMFPRTAISPMANAVRAAMGEAAATVETEIVGRTTADRDVIDRLGRSVWPTAARLLADSPPPAGWADTGLSDRQFRHLARIAAAVLGQAPALDALYADTANGLLPPRPEAIHAVLQGAADLSEHALPMVICLMLTRLPEAAKVLDDFYTGQKASGMLTALEQAKDLLISQLETEGPGARIAAGSLLAASVTARNLEKLLTHLGSTTKDPLRRTRVDRIRGQLDTACRARFQTSLEKELVERVADPTALMSPRAIPDLEATARGLRALETEARAVGGGRSYDMLLAQAARTVKSAQMKEHLGLADRMRMVEILEGPEAALAMMRPGM
jgi:hypothetical protein